jgi:pilus assembly protein Flp/PilA
MQKFSNKLSRVLAKAKKLGQSGATAIEYGLIASLIAVVIIGTVTAMGTGASTTFSKVAAQLGT